jgi:hypothetical protein
MEAPVEPDGNKSIPSSGAATPCRNLCRPSVILLIDMPTEAIAETAVFRTENPEIVVLSDAVFEF